MAMCDVSDLRAGDSFHYLGRRLTCRGVDVLALERGKSKLFQQVRLETDERGPLIVYAGTTVRVFPPEDGLTTPLERAVLACAPLMGQHARDRVVAVADGTAELTTIDHALEEAGIISIEPGLPERPTLNLPETGPRLLLTDLGTELHRRFTEQPL